MANVEPAEALERLEKLIDQIENDVPERAKETASDFFEDVASSARDMLETIERIGRVTDRQASAIAGWERGVGRWIR